MKRWLVFTTVLGIVFWVAFPSRIKAQAQSPQVTKNPSTLGVEACEAARKSIGQYWLEQNGFWFSKEENSQRYWQLKNVEITVKKEEKLTTADVLNGVTWKGTVQCRTEAYRICLDGFGWIEWVDEIKQDYQVSQKKGSWLGPFDGFPVETKKFFVKPSTKEVDRILRQPVMESDEAIRPTLLTDPQSRSWVSSITNNPQADGSYYLVLLVQCGADSTVGDIQIFRSGGTAIDQAAITCVRKNLKFRPALQNGSSVSAWITITFRFRVSR